MKLKTAIETAAAKHDVTIFSSLADELPKSDSEGVYPTSLKNHVIRIGAARVEGHALDNVDKEAADFLLPCFEKPINKYNRSHA